LDFPGKPKSLNGPVIYVACRFETLFPLEGDESLARTRAPFAIGMAVQIPLLDQHGLYFADLGRAEIHGRGTAFHRSMRRRTPRNDRNNFSTVVHDHDLVANDEILMTAPLRVDLDDRLRHPCKVYMRRNDRPDAH